MILTILRVLFLRLRNNPLELLLVFVVPVVFFSIFAVIFSRGIATGSDKKLRVGWIAAREIPVHVELRKFLEANATLQCVSLTQSVAVSGSQQVGEKIAATIADAQRSGRYDVIIWLPEEVGTTRGDSRDLEPCALTLVTDGQNPMAVAMVSSILKGFFAQRQAESVAARFANLRASTQPVRGSAEAREFLHGGTGGTTRRPMATSPAPQASGRQTRYLDPVKEPSQVFTREWPEVSLEPVEGRRDGVSATADRGGRPVQSRPSPEEPAEIIRKQEQGREAAELVSIRVINPQADSQENPRIAMYAAGVAVLFLLFSSTGNAAALLEEAESGTLDRILVSQAQLIHIVGGKWLGILLLGCLQITVMFVWAEVVFGIQLVEHLAGFGIMTVSTAAATASFAMLLATLCKSRAQLNAVSVVLILSMSAVGGSMIPRFAMSDRMKEIGRWTFNAWALDGYQKVFWFQSPLTDLVNEVAVLLGSSVVLGMMALMFSGRWKRG